VCYKGKEKEGELDAISITPGTAFMARLSQHFQYFILLKMEHDHVWQACTVIFSGSEVPICRCSLPVTHLVDHVASKSAQAR
jgi:5'-3' exonuclease